MSNHKIEVEFPKLRIANYKISSPATIDYNCIAWAAGDTEAWWWPDPLYIYYWPPGLPRTETLQAFVTVFEAIGYTPCDNHDYEDGCEKVAIYVDANRKPTHAARQLSSGYWTSKLGKLEDIEHSLQDISGSRYGSVAMVMKRPK